MPKYYLTTPIYYVNARPHIGHAYTTIVADVLARRHRLLGDDTFFLTGTDEHGQKIERSALAAGVPPQQFTDEVSASFRALWDRMGLTYDKFIRTTSPEHKRGVQQLFQQLLDKGAIYLSSYTGSYCVSDEAFVDLPAGAPCPDCGRPLETVTEENYFFKLSQYQLPLLNLIESSDPENRLLIQPEARRNEVLSFLRGPVAQTKIDPVILSEARSAQSKDPEEPGVTASARTFRAEEAAAEPAQTLAYSAAGTPYVPGALKDLSISRTSFKWGIPVPDQPAPEATSDQPGGHTSKATDDNSQDPEGHASKLPENSSRETSSASAPEGHAFRRAENSLAEGDSALPKAVLPKDQHVIYVWLDALANYMTALGYGSDDDSLWQKYWPADLHIVGKEIIRFHCVYWPAFLLAAGLPTPKQVVAHGWLLFEESKMSKSRGNIVRTETILDAFGPLCPTPEAVVPNLNEVKGMNPEGAVTTPTARTFQPEISPSSSHANEAVILSEAKNPEGANATQGVRTFQPPSSAAQNLKHHQDLFASDVLRYFLLREIPFGQDGSFSFDALVTRYNADLANGYGNLVSRTLSMIKKFFDGRIPFSNKRTASEYMSTSTIDGVAGHTIEGFSKGLASNDFSGAIHYLSSFFIAAVDLHITSSAPWKIKPEGPFAMEQLADILYPAAESIRIITALLYPILPYATASVWRQLGLGDIEQAARNGELKDLKWGGLKPGTRLGPLAPIFPRADKGLTQIMTDMESPAPPSSKPDDLTAVTEQHDTLNPASDDLPTGPIASEPPSHDPAAGPRTATLAEPNPGLQVAGSRAETTERHGTPHHQEAQASGIFSGAPSQPADSSPQIAIDDFAKVELRVAQILVAERIPKADKLLRLEVDLGYEKRQILSGIAEWYTPEDLIGRRIVVITNLAPRKMRGLESHGMLLAASAAEGGKPALATFADSDTLPLGSRLK